jgi:hypothetical protein
MRGFKAKAGWLRIGVSTNAEDADGDWHPVNRRCVAIGNQW